MTAKKEYYKVHLENIKELHKRTQQEDANLIIQFNNAETLYTETKVILSFFAYAWSVNASISICVHT